MRVRGVDGYRHGWIAIDLVDGRYAGTHVHAHFDAMVAAGPSVIGVDMPIGLLDVPREADGAARMALGPRRASIFAAPPRSVLSCVTYAEANRVAKTLGAGLSRQSHNLIPKIIELDAFASDPRIVEVHPELSFAALAGGMSLSHPKKTWYGQAMRRRLLERAGIHLPDDLGAGNDVPPDDVLDAAAAAWSANRVSLGTARSYPAEPTQLDGARLIAIYA